MPHPSRNLLFAGVALAMAATGGLARAQVVDAGATALEGVVVTGARTRTSAVTGLDLSLRETPQSVTIINQDRIDDFGLTNVNELLAQVTGVNVEKVETDRTYYNSRGFDITNFQVDGIGLPLIWGIQFGDLDTVLFERVEAVRGANSMMTGTGNPSATINYVRKRPTAAFQASASAAYGSWDDYRLEADVSGPLNAGAFPPDAVDGTFGCQQVFVAAPPTANASPATEYQFFGRVAIDAASRELTVHLHDNTGASLWSKTLTPHRR